MNPQAGDARSEKGVQSPDLFSSLLAKPFSPITGEGEEVQAQPEPEPPQLVCRVCGDPNCLTPSL